MRIELDAPNFSGCEKEYLCRCIDSEFVSTFGPFVPEFEQKFAKYLGILKTASMQSGTSAIQMALHECGIGRGDEVIVPALTFIATVNPVSYLGAVPVFTDVDIKTWNIDPQDIERKITNKTKAIIPVHLYGNPCDMDAILAIAKKYNLYVIEDATESLGAKHRNKHMGTFGDFGCFSFNGNKTITTGGGGMIAGKDKSKVEHIKFLSNQARDETKGYYHPEIGFNCRMTNLEAALGLAQMERLDFLLSRKRQINQIYKNELKNIAYIIFQEEYDFAKSSCWFSCILFEKEICFDSLQGKLKEKKIPSRRVFMPVVEFPPYKKYKMGDYKNAYTIYNKALCLPSSTLNSDEDIHYVCNILRKVL